ncbi:MAG: hypothetical protein K2X29_07030 [Candidatus Obscuribacterales bacterium]|nr:hypothetical protein [Candidatus Obscuribacterales bacterium]
MIKRVRSNSSRIRTRGKARARGHYLAEVPGVLFVLFFFFVFPLINLGSYGLGYAALFHAARAGAHAGATAPAFQTVVSGKPPAITVAPQAVNDIASKYTLIYGQTTDVDILQIPTPAGTMVRWPNKLSAAANTAANVYAIEVIVTANVRPIIPWWFFTSINNVQAAASEFSEAPNGLDD